MGGVRRLPPTPAPEFPRVSFREEETEHAVTWPRRISPAGFTGQQDGLHNFGGPVQNANEGPLVRKLLRTSDEQNIL